MPKRYYVGFAKGSKDSVFTSDIEPTFDTHGHIYFGVMGPFKTKRAAQFTADNGRMNPHVQTVSDAERIAKRRAAQ